MLLSGFCVIRFWLNSVLTPQRCNLRYLSSPNQNENPSHLCSLSEDEEEEEGSGKKTDPKRKNPIFLTFQKKSSSIYSPGYRVKISCSIHVRFQVMGFLNRHEAEEE